MTEGIDYEQQALDKIDEGKELDEKFLGDLIHGGYGKIVEQQDGEDRRWQRNPEGVPSGARMMQTFKHHDFQQFLIAKAEEYSSKVVLVNEAYTSKTCSFCGKIHKIGSKKVLKCSCGVEVDRDLNGARGIMLRALVVTPRQDLSAIVNDC